MTIYDVPVDDTVFFPVSGDMLRRMKHDEEKSPRTENDPGDPAKNHTEVVTGPNTHQGERTIMKQPTTAAQTTLDVTRHPVWCDPDQCAAPFIPGDITIHFQKLGTLDVPNSQVDLQLFQVDDAAPQISIDGNAEMDLTKIDELLALLTTARQRLIDTGEAR